MEIRHRTPTVETADYDYLSQVSPDISCPAQILVVDRDNGAADILMDTVSRLLDQTVSITSVSDQNDAIRTLEHHYFDLVVIGLERDRPDHIALVPYIRNHRPGLPVVVVGHQIHHRSRDRAKEFGADRVINLPRRSSDLKALVESLAQHYLEPIF